MRTDIEKIKEKIIELGEDNIVCVLTTTSCFAPRGHDNILEISKICQENKIAHIINNAYGVQSNQICKYNI